MSENFKIDISGIKSDFIDTLMNKYAKNITVKHNPENNTVQLQISKSVDENFLVNTIDNFINNFNDFNNKELVPSWFFDENSSTVKGPSENFLLTPREVLFLKMLLKNDKIITYAEMVGVLWQNSNNVSRNAIRSFAKNINKKLPPNILKNVQSIGYTLAL